MDLRATEWAVWAAPDARLMRHSKYPDPSPVIPWNRAMISLSITGNIGGTIRILPFFSSAFNPKLFEISQIFGIFFPFLFSFFFDIYSISIFGNWIKLDHIDSTLPIISFNDLERISNIPSFLEIELFVEIILFRSACEVKIVSGRGREKATKL